MVYGLPAQKTQIVNAPVQVQVQVKTGHKKATADGRGSPLWFGCWRPCGHYATKQPWLSS